MKLLNKLGGLTLALALCAGLLAGCGSVTDKAAPPEEAETQEVQETAEPAVENTEETAEAASGFDADALTEALNDVCGVGPGAAGSSLRAVKAAGELVYFAATNWNDDSAQAITDAIGVWFEGLEAEEKEEFHLGREMVENTVGDIVDRPMDPDIQGLLEDAGLPNLGLATLDLTHTDDLLRAIRGQTGAVTEND